MATVKDVGDPQGEVAADQLPRECRLRIGIDRQNTRAATSRDHGEIRREGCLPDSTLLVRYGNDFHVSILGIYFHFRNCFHF
jgi:hypothetical protein